LIVTTQKIGSIISDVGRGHLFKKTPELQNEKGKSKVYSGQIQSSEDKISRCWPRRSYK
jgi:hypothetical protein